MREDNRLFLIHDSDEEKSLEERKCNFSVGLLINFKLLDSSVYNIEKLLESKSASRKTIFK